MQTVQEFLPAMLETNYGHIVNMNSVLGFTGLAGAADYCASKFAASGFSEALRMEISTTGQTGVMVTDVHPYLIDTDMFAGCTSSSW